MYFLARDEAKTLEKKLRRQLDVMRFGERIVPVRTDDQDARGDHGMKRDDRSHHERGDLPADSPEIEEAGQPHDRLPAPEETDCTVGVNR